jgi:hypothetical protein
MEFTTQDKLTPTIDCLVRKSMPTSNGIHFMQQTEQTRSTPFIVLGSSNTTMSIENSSTSHVCLEDSGGTTLKCLYTINRITIRLRVKLISV